MIIRAFSKGIRFIPGLLRPKKEEVVVAWIDPFYVVTILHTELTNDRLHPNSGAPNYNVKHDISDVVIDQNLDLGSYDLITLGDLSGAALTLTGLATLGDRVEFGKTAHFDAEFDNGNSGAGDAIDWRVGNKQKSTLTGDVTYTFTDPTGPCNLIFRLIQDGTGGRDVTWPAAVKWLGTEPTWSDGAAGKTIVVSFYHDGTNYWAQGTPWET